jgi:hypothetical protein
MRILIRFFADDAWARSAIRLGGAAAECLVLCFLAFRGDRGRNTWCTDIGN